MEESNYKHNYEYLSIEEAKSIIGGTFVQGTTSIGGELATKADIDKLLTAADKKLTSIVPVTDTSNEFICFFECISNETFPDDLEHRWIEVSPIQFTFPADGGSVKITGSYGLTGTLGTRKKVGDIADTITAGANATPSTKNGSKTYYYNNDQSQTPTAKVSWTQPNKDEEFPDDEAHRWIRVQPESSQIPVDGGTINVTGSYGLTGTYGTEKKVGDITDTIVVEPNSTQDQKSGSKTYYYNNNQSDTPTAEITWTQPGRAEEFPDDEAHRWIRVQPESSQIPVDGGTINVTGSYGLTGTYGTEKKVGDITDTIVVEPNSTQDQKSGSKTYYYNNNQSDTPTAEITWTQPGRAEEFPDDEAHRWIEITPTDAGNFTEAGGTITVTGSYGLTGSFGTKKTVGQINDTITVEKNTTTQTKSGSKTYYYNNTPGTDPSATVTWTQDAHATITPTSVHVTNIILQVGQNQQIQYEVTPSNADVDTCTYEVTSGSDYVHITDGVVYADAVGEATCKITINGTVESTFQVNVINGNAERYNGDVFIVQTPGGGGTTLVDFHSPEYCINPYTKSPQSNNYMVYNDFYIQGVDHGVFHTAQNNIIDIEQIRKTYKQIKDKPSLIKGKTIEQACSMNGGHYVYVYLYSDSWWVGEVDTLHTLKCRAYKKSSNSSISVDGQWLELNGYTATGDIKYINYLTYGTCVDFLTYRNIDYAPSYSGDSGRVITCDYFNKCGTLYSYLLIDLDQNNETFVFDFASSNDGYFKKGYNVNRDNWNDIKEMTVDYTQNSLDTTGDYIKLNITINKINNSTDISNLRGNMVAWCFSDGQYNAKAAFYGTDSNGVFFNITDEQTLPYTTQINIPKKDFNKVQLYLSALNTNDSFIYRSAPIEITL